jgi:non-heme chloroperoxidase
MPTQAKTVQLSSDLTLDFVEQGEPGAVPLLLLHGLGDSRRSYEPVLEHLPRSVRAFALSQRGHGDSSRPEDGYAFRHFVADIEAFLEVLDIESAVMAGHSSHGVVIEKFAMEHATRALGLVLIGTPVTLRSNESARDLYESTISKLSDPLDPDFVHRFADATLAHPVSPAFLEIVTEEAMKVPARVFKEFFKDLIETDLSPELNKIDAPALLVWGDQDAILSRGDQETLANALRNSRLVVYPGAGHSPHWEEPEHFASDLVDFIKEL